MTEFKFECPRCHGREYGTITRGNGSKAYACHGIQTVNGVSRSCDFEIPIAGSPVDRTREDRAAQLLGLKRAAEQLMRGFEQVDPDDELALLECEAALGEMQSTVILLRDDAVSARVEREAQSS